MSPSRPVRATVLGAGSWGTALAVLACDQADTLLWARNPAVAQEINGQHTNHGYLPDAQLPAVLRATDNIQDAVSHACAGEDPGLIILGVPVAGLQALCERVASLLANSKAPQPAIVWTCKGFHHETGQLPHELARAAFAAFPDIGLGVLSGPSFAREVAAGLPVALTVATADERCSQLVLSALHGRTARIYTSHDVVGVEVGGALKNVMAIACGISDGLALGTNARAALITRGLAEMQRLGTALGGLPETFAGLTGLGDLVLTATGALSRNRQVGLAIGQGQSLDDILASGVTAEGVRCTRSALALGRRHGIELPITAAVCRILFEGLSPQEAVIGLLSRDARPESAIHPTDPSTP